MGSFRKQMRISLHFVEFHPVTRAPRGNSIETSLDG